MRRLLCTLATLAGAALFPVAADAATLHVAPGATGTACTAFAPCGTFDAAYRASQPGDVVEVAGGTYGNQTIPAVAGRTGPDVVFRPALGARVTISRDLNFYGSHVEVAGMAVLDRWYAYAGAHHVTVRDVDSQRFYVRSTTDIAIIGGVLSSPEATGVPSISASGSGFPTPQRISIDGTRFERIWRPQGDSTSHVECLHVMGVDGLTIRNTTFSECLGNTSALSFNIHFGSVIEGVVVEDSLIAEKTYNGGAYPQPTGTGPSINISDRSPGYEITFRRIRSLDSKAFVPQGKPIYPGAIRIEDSCFVGPKPTGLRTNEYVWSGNAFSSACSSTPIPTPEPAPTPEPTPTPTPSPDTATASYTVTPLVPVAGQPVMFDASSSACVEPCSYAWSDDGPDGPGGRDWPLGAGAMLTFTFDESGAATKGIRLTVTGADGGRDTTVQQVTVQPAPVPEPTPEPTPEPDPTPTPTPEPTPEPEPSYQPACAPTCDEQIAALRQQLTRIRAILDE